MARRGATVIESGPELLYSKDEILNKRLETVVEGCKPHVQKLVKELSEENKRTLADFIMDGIVQSNIKPNTKTAHIKNFVYLVRFWRKPKIEISIKDMKKEHINGYMQSLIRPQSTDPDQKWIRTSNNRAMTYTKLFRFLAAPDKKPKERPKPATIDVISGIVFYEPKEKSPVKPEHLWTDEMDAIFIKYCPDKRLAFYHTLADDTSGRPHELLSRRIGEVKMFKRDNIIYAEMEIGRGGKTRARVVPLIRSLPYFKSWLREHPQATNPNAYIFLSQEPKAKYRNKHIEEITLNINYRDMKLEYFPKLLERPDVPPEDKKIIELMLQKPWNPYIQRHTSLNEKVHLLNEYDFRQHGGWTKKSDMIEVYTHDLGGESSKGLLAAYGILPKEGPEGSVLQPKYCPNCNEPNKPDSKYCENDTCGHPLSFEAYKEQKDREAEKDKRIDEMSKRLDENDRRWEEFIKQRGDHMKGK